MLASLSGFSPRQRQDVMLLSFVPAIPICTGFKTPKSKCAQRKLRRGVVDTSMALTRNGQLSLYTGIAVLTTVLTNRILFTPLDSLALTQSRSDILGVITGATLVLYGVGKVEVSDTKEAVDLGGEDVVRGFDQLPADIASEVEWAASSLIQAITNVQSCAIVMNGVGRCFQGRFREKNVSMTVRKDGVIDRALQKQQRAYLADMKTVPVKELEFGFLPTNCQEPDLHHREMKAVVVQPVSEDMALILGADKPRPFTGTDFGWLQAVSDRLAGVMASQQV